MELRRDLIERGDFPPAEDGLDPEAVRAHLHAIADAVEEQAERVGAQAAEPAASAAPAPTGQRVQAILDAAERTASEVEEAAEAEAERMLADARERAVKVDAAAARLLERVTALQGQLDAAGDDVRAEADVVRGALPGADRAVAQSAPPEAAVAPDPAEPEPAEREPVEPEAATEPESEPGRAAPPGDTPGEGPRLIALNMALGGAPREEVARYLEENFALDDPGEILDDVFARTGG